MSKRQILICAIIPSLTLLAIAIFIWPTPYKYEKHNFTIYRITRFTGETHMLVVGRGWINLTPTYVSEWIPPEELSKITATARIVTEKDPISGLTKSHIRVEVYNGSTRIVSGLKIKLAGEGWDCKGTINPDTTQHYIIKDFVSYKKLPANRPLSLTKQVLLSQNLREISPDVTAEGQPMVSIISAWESRQQ